MFKETKRLRADSEVDKIIAATFKKLIDDYGVLDPNPYQTVYDDGNKTSHFGWTKFDGKQVILRRAEVRIYERHLEVWAYISGLIGRLEDYTIGLKEDRIGDLIRLPLFSNILERRIFDAYIQAEEWTASDLEKVQEQQVRGVGSVSQAIDLNVKDFVTGI